MKKIKIGIFGPKGRMGESILKQIKNFSELQVSSLCENKKHPIVGRELERMIVHSNLKKLVDESDVIIDFTIPEATMNLLEELGKSNKKTALITGTTGFTKSQEKKFLELSKGLKILQSFNMSLGINILKELVKKTAKKISEESDIEISETHHNLKRDIPSGTALTLADSINEGAKLKKKHSYRLQSANLVRKKNEIGFSSIRGGDVVGEHSVYFFLDGERIELTHRALDRKIFSNGALRAAVWIFKKKPGMYSLIDVLG